MDKIYAEMNEKDFTGGTNKRRISSVSITYQYIFLVEERMNTLLHAPMHTLQQMECLDANPSQELNIVNRTLIFSEQNEMDMTSGHTILITHDTKVCQETDKPKKINFESFLSEIKPKKKASQVTETCFSYSSVQMNESNLSQQKTNTEKTHKINLGDFLESLRSSKLFSASSDESIPSGGAASERSTYSSKQNACSHLQTENCNMPTVFGELDNRQHGETSVLSFEKAILSASKQLGCAESMDVITANTERLLPSGTSASSMINQQRDLGKDKSVAHSTVSCTLGTSNYQLDIQQNANMFPSKINNKEANINHNSAIKITNKDILPSQTSFGTITAPSVTSVPILHGDKTNFSEDMEMTKNCTGLIWEVHSKGTDSPVHGLVQKQRNDVFELMDRTNFREIEMDITKNHASMNSYLNSMHHSNLVSKMTTADLQNDHGSMDLNQRVNLSAARNINLNTSPVSKNFKEQVETPLVPYTTSGITKWTNSAIGDSTINRTIGLSNNAVSLIPEHENIFAPSENMEISKAVGSLRHNSLKPFAFWDIPQQLTSASRKSITDSDSDKVMALPLSKDNDMEITKSCTVPVNYNMLRHERTTEVFPLESVDKTTNIYNDMDETKPITCIISQHVENSGSQIMQQQKRSGTTSPTKDRTIVFSLNDGNEMDITRSYTVALNHDAVTSAEDRPVLSIVSSNKTILSPLNDDMEITNSVASETLRSISDFLNVPKQNAETGRKTIESDSDMSVAFPLSVNNKLEFRKNLTEPVEKAPQEQSLSSEENININISNHMPVNKSMSLAPSDKTVMFVHNNDMEITKPISMTSIKNIGFETLQLKNKENGKAILLKSAKEGTDLCLDENEMEMTRSHTVAVNYELQHAKAAPQKLFLDPANETSLSVHNNYETISKSSSLVPAENTMIMRNHDMEMTKSLSAEIFKNSLKCLAQKRNLNCESALADPVKISVFAQQHNEMEITKCHTVLVNHDDVFHNEKILQIPVQSNMDAAGFPTIAKNPEENFHKNKTEPEKNTEWEFSSNQTANEPVNTNMHAVLFDNKTIEYCQVASQTKQLFPFNETNAFTSYQDGTEATSLHSGAISCGNLQEFKKEMLGKNMEQNREEKTNYLEFIKKNTVTNKEHNCYQLPAEKQIPSTSRMSKEKTVAFSDDGSMEVTSNYTTGIERIFMSDRNERELHSLGISNVEFSASIVDCEKKLNIDKTKSEKSIVRMQQSILNTKERQLEPCTAKVNNHMKETISIVDSNKENELIFPTRKSSLAPALSDEIGLNRKKPLLDESKMEKDDLKKISQSMQLDDITIKATDVLPYGDKTGKKPEWGSFSKDQHNNLRSSPINIILPVEEPVILNKGSSVVSNCPKLQDIEKKPELVLFSCDDKTNLSEELPKLIMKPDCSLKEDRRIESNAMASKAGINTNSTEGIPLSASLNTDNSKIRIMPLAIFPPKLPNKRKSALSNIEAPAAKLDKNSEIQDSEVSLLAKSSLDKITQKSDPFYIDEELLPSYAAEMDSNESLCHEVPGKCPDEIHEKMIINNEMFETNQKLKRPRNQENEDIQGEKKFKKDMDRNDITEQKQILHSTEVPHNNIETDENKHIPEVGPTKWEKKQSSKNNLFDSFKADTSCNIQQNSKLETQLLMDSICEQNLQEKLLEGTITVREFFTLLQVHVLIQVPRQSQLPVKHTVNTSSIPEDEILSHCIYHPKLQVYKEDCQTLHMIIEELKIHAADQDKLLVNINKSFWEVMKTCSEEELRGFGAELNKMKSCFTKKSKILAHKGKAKLYVKLVHHAKLQFEKLQSRLAKMDELLKEIDSCLFALEKETATLDYSELDANYAMEEHETKVKHIERELENYKSQQDNLQRGQSDLSDKKQQIISEINQLQRNVRSCQELTEKYNFSEWVIKEWNDHQAVFTFLYDSIELTVGFKCPLDDATFRNKLSWEIVSLNFETLLDETKAAPTAKLVHKLIFQFIDSQKSWQKKCSAVHQLSQMLHDLSLVVNRCQLLGEEIEFLNKWGGKFYLLKTEVNNTNVSFLFSSSTPFAKFEVELSLSANYPTSPIVFTIQKCTGNLGHDEISVILSSVPVGANYLKRMVNQISCHLRQHSSAILINKRATVQ
ncbi:kinetochore scaffold 1 [Notechis scutatus]|uniref:Kinetochore scaffold 1 n=1 Tax=Notechis scutatus TaxID=8663 RepID=A0A6J1TUB4_9SAUR|nr:kinetochore scaffold 1 [Notechis scutatus]